jgi:superfamily II DNA or RNA helicase
MGSIGYRVERQPEHTLVSCVLYEGGKRKEIMTRDGRISMPSMLNVLANDPQRNECIAEHMRRLFHANRCMIVLTDRICQLKALLELLIARDVPSSDISFYIGTTPAAERERASQRRVILSTYSMAKEGLDIPRLDTLILATPKGDIVQASGRVQRKHPDKGVPLIVDVVDTFSVFERLRWKRWNYYRREKFQCQTFGIANADAEWYA